MHWTPRTYNCHNLSANNWDTYSALPLMTVPILVQFWTEANRMIVGYWPSLVTTLFGFIKKCAPWATLRYTAGMGRGQLTRPDLCFHWQNDRIDCFLEPNNKSLIQQSKCNFFPAGRTLEGFAERSQICRGYTAENTFSFEAAMLFPSECA